eukprot:12835515-Alexandrium_andersonii.AAC.1
MVFAERAHGAMSFGLKLPVLLPAHKGALDRVAKYLDLTKGSSNTRAFLEKVLGLKEVAEYVPKPIDVDGGAKVDPPVVVGGQKPERDGAAVGDTGREAEGTPEAPAATAVDAA